MTRVCTRDRPSRPAAYTILVFAIVGIVARDPERTVARRIGMTWPPILIGAVPAVGLRVPFRPHGPTKDTNVAMPVNSLTGATA